jgi:hypothetical protein
MTLVFYCFLPRGDTGGVQLALPRKLLCQHEAAFINHW